ncbi:MAG: hypothetical protein K2H09_03460 [Treponemataceae bacterium]|nr:hypothetical protein [Treponemataceae bacterium]
MAEKKSIVLVGIKHSGKTTQGRLLAKRYGCPFIDIDDEIMRLAGRTPRELYLAQGQDGFLAAEAQACTDAAAQCAGRRAVISTGGGICDNPPALEALRSCGTFVFLKVPEKTAADRIFKKARRLADGEWRNLPAYIAGRHPASEDDARRIFHDFYVARDAAYSRLADITITADCASKDENSARILACLESAAQLNATD